MLILNQKSSKTKHQLKEVLEQALKSEVEPFSLLSAFCTIKQQTLPELRAYLKCTHSAAQKDIHLHLSYFVRIAHGREKFAG